MTVIDNLEFRKYKQHTCPWAWGLTLVFVSEVKDLRQKLKVLNKEVTELKRQLKEQTRLPTHTPLVPTTTETRSVTQTNNTYVHQNVIPGPAPSV